MSKMICLACSLGLLCFFAKPSNDRFSGYKPVEAYEVRPGIIMTPTYSADGQVCQVVIERQHYLNGTVDLDSTMPHDAVNQIVNKLVPNEEKGPLTTDKEMARLSIYAGNTVTSFVDYKNISVDISRQPSSRGDIVAVIKWKRELCK